MDALNKANVQLSHKVGKRHNNDNWLDSPAPCSNKMFPHCKIEWIHIPVGCFDLEKNSHKRAKGWKSRLW